MMTLNSIGNTQPDLHIPRKMSAKSPALLAAEADRTKARAHVCFGDCRARPGTTYVGAIPPLKQHGECVLSGIAR
jgi:hypothetical protein